MVMGSSFTSPLLVYTLRAAEFHPSLQHAIQNDEHQVGDRHYGALFPSAWSQSLESDGKYGAMFAGCCPGALNQGRTQIGIPMCSLATLLNASAFPIPRTQPCPTRQLLRTRKRRQIGSGLGQDCGRRKAAHSGHGLQQAKRRLKWRRLHPPKDFIVQCFDFLLQTP